MVNLIEKIIYVYCASVLILVGLVYFIFGGHETTPRLFLPKIKPIHQEKQAFANSNQTPNLTPLHTSEGSKIAVPIQGVENLKKLGFSQTKITQTERMEFHLPEPKYQYIRNQRNWLPELHKIARDESNQNLNTLIITGIDDDSLTKELGIQSGDKIVMIDDEIWEFTPTKAQDYIQKVERLFQKYEKGESLTITLERNGRLMRLEFHK